MVSGGMGLCLVFWVLGCVVLGWCGRVWVWVDLVVEFWVCWWLFWVCGLVFEVCG